MIRTTPVMRKINDVVNKGTNVDCCKCKKKNIKQTEGYYHCGN